MSEIETLVLACAAVGLAGVMGVGLFYLAVRLMDRL